MTAAAHLVLKELRLRQTPKVTQKQVADILGVAEGTYSRKETGQIGTSLEDIEKIAEFYGLTIQDLFGTISPLDNDKSELETLKSEVKELSEVIVELNKQLVQKDREISRLKQERGRAPSPER